MGKISLNVCEPGSESSSATHEFSQGVFKIGTLPSSHLRLSDVTVSRMHAVIESEGDEFWITDLASAAGTCINGKRTRGRQLLRNGDEIQMGQTRIVVKRL